MDRNEKKVKERKKIKKWNETYPLQRPSRNKKPFPGRKPNQRRERKKK
jgi:hypothetical protein